MNPKLFVGVVTDEKLGKSLDMCLRHFWLLGIIREAIIAMELLAHTKYAKEQLDGLHDVAVIQVYR